LRIALLGLGLIGGSIGLAARDRAKARVSGYDPDPAALARALELGAIDEACADAATALGDAQIAIVAAPVKALPSAVESALALTSKECVVSDVGSTKAPLAALGLDTRFIGGHPLAGAESAGIEHARADLFEGATWYLTPAPGTPATALERLGALIEELGATPLTIDPLEHDRLMACVSHLPHVFANVLVSQALAAASPPSAVGPSFRDATRVAGANPLLWTDIYLSNRAALAAAIEESLQRLREVRDALASADHDALARWHQSAERDRNRLLDGAIDPGDANRSGGQTGPQQG
jgi:prephenate dehydrogenase